MARGGAREGAGRKKSQASQRSEETMQLAAEMGVDPVEMLLDLTKWAYGEFNKRDEVTGLYLGRTKENADMVRDYAKECAPYVRPKLSSIEASGPDGGAILVETVRFSEADSAS